MRSKGWLVTKESFQEPIRAGVCVLMSGVCTKKCYFLNLKRSFEGFCWIFCQSGNMAFGFGKQMMFWDDFRFFSMLSLTTEG